MQAQSAGSGRSTLSLQATQTPPGLFPGFAQPVLVVELSGCDRAPPAVFAAIDEALRSALPGYEAPAGAAADPDALARRVAGAAGAVLREAGMPMFSEPAVAVGGASGDGPSVVLPTLGQAHLAAREALEWALRLANAALAGADPGALVAELPTVLEGIRSHAPQGMNTQFFLQAAQDAGIPWRRILGNVFQFGWGSRSRLFDSSFTDATPHLSARIARDKRATAVVLRQGGVPVPAHVQVADADAAVAAARRLGFPVVVKPADLDGGRGVAAGLASETGVRAAFARAQALSKNVLVEKHVEGNDYRLHVFHDEVVWALHRVPGGVTGDGVATVRDLLRLLNADPLRGEPGSKAKLKRIALDDEALGLLAEQGLSPDEVPGAGRFVRLRRTANVAAGGLPVPVLEQAHPDNLALAVRAVRLLRLDLAGVDLLMPDIRRSWLETGAAICEVNAQPQLWSNLPALILKALVPGDGRIPVAIILGDDGQSAWVEALARQLAGAGRRVGIAAPDAVRIDGRVVANRRADALTQAGALLADPVVDLALVCVGDARMLVTGLPVDRFDLLVLAGPPTPDAGAETWAHWVALARMARAMCRGPVILNADCAPWLVAAERLGFPVAARPARELAATVRAGLEGRP